MTIPRYRHPSHKHRLEYCTAGGDRECDICKGDIETGHIRFCCPRCDYDLCPGCFEGLAGRTVALSDSDAEMDDELRLDSSMQVD